LELKNFGLEPTTTTVKISQPAPKDGKEPSFKGSLQQKHSFCGFGLDYTVTGENGVQGEITRNDFFAKGLKAKLGQDFQLSSGDLKLTPGFEFKNATLNGGFNLDLPLKMHDANENIQPTGAFSLVGKYGNGFVGVNAAASKTGLQSLAGKLQYQTGKFSASFGLCSKEGKLSSETNFFTETSLGAYPSKLGVNLKRSERTDLALGLESTLSDSSALKAKFDLQGSLATSITQTIARNAKLTVGYEYNLKTKTSGNVGFKLLITDN